MPSLGKYRGMGEFEKAVHKATNSKNEPPKRKHVRSIIIETTQINSVGHFYEILFQRPLDTSEVVCWKALVCIHKVLLEGPEATISDSRGKLSFFESLRNVWKNSIDRGYSTLISDYGTVLINKINFHGNYPDIPGSFDLDKYLQNHPNVNLEKDQQICTQLMDIQDSMFSLQADVFNARGGINDLKCSCFIPIIAETYSIYTLITHLLTQLVKKLDTMDVFDFLVSRFYKQYPVLRQFYIEANNIRSVSSIIAVPNLPFDPPKFMIPAKPKAKTKPKKVPVPEPEPEPEPIREPSPSPFFEAPSPTPVMRKLSNPPPQWTSFAKDEPFLSPKPVHTPPPVIVTKEPEPEPVDSKYEEMMRKRREEKEAKEREEQRTKVITKIITKTDDKEIQRLQAELEEMTKRWEIEKENVQTLQDQLAKKEAMIAKLQSGGQALIKLRDRLQNEAKEMQIEIQKLSGEVENLNEETDQIKFQQRVKEIETALEAILKCLNVLDNPSNMGNTNATPQLVISDSNQIQQTVANLLEVCKNEDSDDSDLFNAISGVTQDLTTLFTDAKGTSRGINDLQVRNKLLDLSRGVGKTTETLLETIRMQGGDANDEEEIAELSSNFGDFQTSVISLIEHSKSVEDVLLAEKEKEIREEEIKREKLKIISEEEEKKKQWLLKEEEKIKQTQLQAQEEYEKLQQLRLEAEKMQKEQEEKRERELIEEQERKQKEEELRIKKERETLLEEQKGMENEAENELMMAAKTIEDAAKILLAAKANKQSLGNVPDVTDAILEAALAISNATQSLVVSSAAAQNERIEKGLSNPSDARYNPDPMWAEGLISAAKSVAACTSTLVNIANDVSLGKLDEAEEALIASAKGVSSSTAQLVAATSSKSDPLSQTIGKVNSSAKAVGEATTMLVSAAKALIPEEDDELDYAKLTPTKFKMKEMEQQMKILKLEKELQGAQKYLATMRKLQYAK